MSLKIRRGTNSERLTIIPDEGELLYTVDTKKIFVGDGATTGGSLVTGGLAGNLADNLYLDNHSIIGTNLTVNGQTGSITAASVTAHLRGSVYADDSTVLVDSIQGKVVGPIDVDVTSVRIAGGTSGQVLTTNGNGVISWSNKTNSLISLASLTDVSLFNVRSNDILKWNGNDWINSPNTIFVGDVVGSLFADDSTKIIDGITGNVFANTINCSNFLSNAGNIETNSGSFRNIFSSENIVPLEIRAITTGIPGGGSPYINIALSKGTLSSPTDTAVDEYLGGIKISAYKSGTYKGAVALGAKWAPTADMSLSAPESYAILSVNGTSNSEFFVFDNIGTSITRQIALTGLTQLGAPNPYADATARDAAIASPIPGMICYIADDGTDTPRFQGYKGAPTNAWVNIA